MKCIPASVALFGAFCVAVPASLAQHSGSAQHGGSHVMLLPSELTWNDLPSLPGVKIAVMEGLLTEAVPVMFRLKFPANYKVPPHRHPGIEHITIISGTLNMGMGDMFDASKNPCAHTRQRRHHAARDESLRLDQ